METYRGHRLAFREEPQDLPGPGRSCFSPSSLATSSRSGQRVRYSCQGILPAHPVLRQSGGSNKDHPILTVQHEYQIVDGSQHAGQSLIDGAKFIIPYLLFRFSICAHALLYQSRFFLLRRPSHLPTPKILRSDSAPISGKQGRFFYIGQTENFLGQPLQPYGKTAMGRTSILEDLDVVV